MSSEVVIAELKKKIRLLERRALFLENQLHKHSITIPNTDILITNPPSPHLMACGDGACLDY
tara:strand:+ start:6936 stop:7121 length:186 start_codon:yes stop_codon:yes gene_type:complete